tara:strand:- start:115 stop:363 length:249 start_codon:yes stop_codon:yes gene_type:complete
MQESYYDKFIKRSRYKAYYGDIVDEISWLFINGAFLLTMPSQNIIRQKIAKLATILMVSIIANNQYCFITICALQLAHITIV